MPTLMRLLAERHGREDIRGATYRDVVARIVSHNSRLVQRSVLDADSQAVARAARQRRGVVLPPVEEIMDSEVLQVRKGAESGEMITDTLRERLNAALQAALKERAASGKPLYSSKRGGGLDPEVVASMERRITEAFRPYVKRGKYGVPDNVHAIAVTEVGSAVSDLKQRYTRKLVEANPGYRAVKRWRHFPSLSKVPRLGHHLMNGQEVGLEERFSVPEHVMERGRWVPTGRIILMLHPHDPAAPIGEVVSCHCAAEYVLVPVASLHREERIEREDANVYKAAAPVGAVHQRKDGPYRKVAGGEWEPVPQKEAPSLEEASKAFRAARKELEAARAKGLDEDSPEVAALLAEVRSRADAVSAANRGREVQAPKAEEPESVPEGEYGRAGRRVSGFEVGDRIPNIDSIGSSLGEYRTLPGVREVPMADLPTAGAGYADVRDQERVLELAAQIRESGRVDPLIVVVDSEGPYVLEGAHRLDALHLLGVKSFPALVVVDEGK